MKIIIPKKQNWEPKHELVEMDVNRWTQQYKTKTGENDNGVSNDTSDSGNNGETIDWYPITAVYPIKKPTATEFDALECEFVAEIECFGDDGAITVYSAQKLARAHQSHGLLSFWSHNAPRITKEFLLVHTQTLDASEVEFSHKCVVFFIDICFQYLFLFVLFILLFLFVFLFVFLFLFHTYS